MSDMFSRFPALVGFDDLFDKMNHYAKTKINAWPHYNVVKTGDNKYVIELAIAGFSKSNVNIEMEGNSLRVSGEVTPDAGVEYIHKGISERAFSRSFTLADTVEVKGAEFVNGILKIALENQVKTVDAIKKILIS
jgi:molecular chaperone IbpA